MSTWATWRVCVFNTRLCAPAVDKGVAVSVVASDGLRKEKADCWDARRRKRARRRAMRDSCTQPHPLAHLHKVVAAVGRAVKIEHVRSERCLRLSHEHLSWWKARSEQNGSSGARRDSSAVALHCGSAHTHMHTLSTHTHTHTHTH